MAHIVEIKPEPRVLLVEGQDDKHVVRHLCDRHPSLPDFFVRERNGFDQLLDTIGAELNAPGLQAPGILVDADTDESARWNAVRHRLLEEDINPDSLSATGRVVNPQGKPRVGIWLMPDNESPGELEDFVTRMIPSGDPVWPLSERYIDRIPLENRKFTEKKTSRAKLYAWLAAREEPRQMGLAIGARDLEVDGPLCRNFLVWLTNLFG